MADKKTLKAWFETGDEPKQEQFWEWIDSYWHISDLIPIESIKSINEILLGKADSEALANLALWVNQLDDVLSSQNLIEKVEFLNPNLIVTFQDETTQEIKLPTPETYGVLENGGLEINKDNQFFIQEKGIDETMLNEKLLEKLSKAGGTLQDITKNGNTTDKDIITNEAVLSRDKVNENLKFGKDALKAITTGKKNTAIGDNTLAANQTSPENTAIGYNALNKLDGAGDYNTAIGAYAGQATVESLNCTFVGVAAGNIAKKSNRDTFIGSLTGYSYTGEPRDNGLPIGEQASGSNTLVGDAAGYKMNRGYGNTFIGARSGCYFTYGGAFNTFIGFGIATFTTNTYGSNNVFIGANVPCNGYTSNKLIIHSQGDKANGGSFSTDALITGDFVDRWFKLAGKYVLNYKYTPDVDATPVEGQTAFTPTKMLVADKDGNVGIKKLPTPETPISSDFLCTKNYYSTFFVHTFTETSDTDYIKIQDTIPGNVSNLIIKGRLIVAGAYQEFELIANLNYVGFTSCFYKTQKSEDLLNSIGLVYYDKGQVLMWIKGNLDHSDLYTKIIIDSIQAFEASTNLQWSDDALIEFKASTINESLITASITAQLI